MKNLFHNLIWPAAAGNVAWAFFTVAIEESWAESAVLARLSLLLVLSVYLASDWIATEKEFHRLKPHYWVGDAFHMPTIVVLAIATQMNSPWISCALAVVLLVDMLGHGSTVWEPMGPIRRPWQMRLALFSINAVGLFILAVGEVLYDGSLWHLPIALGAPVLLWTTLRKQIYKQFQ